MVALHRRDDLVAHDVLDAQIDRQLDRLQVRGDRQARRLQVGQPLLVDVFLHAGDALVVDIGQTKDMRGGRAARIEAALLGAEADARHAERHDVGLLLRRQLALQPDEAGAALQLVIGLLDLEIRQHRRQLLDRLVGIDDAARLGEQRRGLDVGGQNLAVAVDDIGPRRGHAARRPAAVVGSCKPK